MSAGPVADEAARLACLVAGIGDQAWSADLRPYLAAVPAAGGGAPTYGDVARAGTALVSGLAQEGRWEEASVQARHLRRFFSAAGMNLGPIAGQAFDGLLAASQARDADELGDFVELVGEMFT